MQVQLPRVLIAGTNSGCGKTTVVCGILQALLERQYPVASFKCGPDYIDPMFHSSILHTKCRNLDLRFFDGEKMRYLLQNGSKNASLALIEGVMGYYDGVGVTEEASSYAVAKATQAPVVLVIDAKGAALSLLATLKGFAELFPDGNIRGIILNRCSAMLYPRLAEAVKKQFSGKIRPLGFLPPLPDCRFESRHLGLITAGEIDDLQEKLHKIALQTEQSIDLAGLLELAASAPVLEYKVPSLPPAGRPARIGIARDWAFCFYYEDNLELLRQLGAELVSFSPLDDAALPDGLDGLYLGGGYPELYPKQLAANSSMRESIRAALEKELPCIAECGGFMYLHEALSGWPMVGFLPGKCENTGHLVRFGYVRLQANRDNLLCGKGQTLQAHEFHYYDSDNPGDTFTASRSTGKSWPCAVTSHTLYAGFPHFHFYSDPQIAARFLAACRKEYPHD